MKPYFLDRSPCINPRIPRPRLTWRRTAALLSAAASLAGAVYFLPVLYSWWTVAAGAASIAAGLACRWYAERKTAEELGRLRLAAAESAEMVLRMDLSARFLCACLQYKKHAAKKEPVKVNGMVLDKNYWWGKVEAAASVRWPDHVWNPHELLAAYEGCVGDSGFECWRRLVGSEFGLTSPL